MERNNFGVYIARRHQLAPEHVRRGIEPAQNSRDCVRLLGSFVAEGEPPPGAGAAPAPRLVLPEAAEDS